MRLRAAAPRGFAAAPLVAGLDLPPWSERIELVLAADDELGALYDRGEVDLALLPAHALGERADRAAVVPGISITSAGPCGIARLDARVPLRDVRRVADRTRGHAAGPLARTLFHGAGRDPEFIPWDGDAAAALVRNDAVVSAGDDVILDPCPPGAAPVDLGEAWTVLTGLPMVWAAWAARPGYVDRRAYALLHAARTRGRHDLALPAGDGEGATGGARTREALRTLAGRIVFRLGRVQLDGLRAFLRAGAAAGVLPPSAPLELLRLHHGPGCLPRPRG